MKLKGVGAYKTGKGIIVVQTSLVDTSPPCKECGKEPRALGSSRCAACSGRHKKHQSEDKRLENKIKKETGRL